MAKKKLSFIIIALLAAMVAALVSFVSCDSEGGVTPDPDPDTRKLPLTLEFTKGGKLGFTNGSPYYFDELYYSKNGGKIVQFSPPSITVEAGDIVCLYANRSEVYSGYLTINCVGCECYVYGNVMSLVSKEGFENLLTIPFDNAFTQLFFQNQGIDLHPDPKKTLVLPATALKKECYKQMFAYCGRLTSAPDLPARYLSPNCYDEMFMGCNNLKKAPNLSALLLASYCYKEMFKGCSSLEEAPALPATRLVNNCYNYMFNGCTALEMAPDLPATKLASNCYEGMFSECTGLTTAPALPVTDLTGYTACYKDMFSGCGNLETAPELPATTLSEACYEGMFINCAKLATLPELHATVMADSCYAYMFQNTGIETVPDGYFTSITKLANSCFYCMFGGCQKLSSPPALPNVKLEPYCYGLMFDACTFKDVPNTYLPATELAIGCYFSMFAENPNLETTPDLPAPVMVDECYECMFYKCPKVKAVTCLATEGIKSPQATTLWLDSVGSEGTFTKKAGSDWDIAGPEGQIPFNWIIIEV